MVGIDIGPKPMFVHGFICHNFNGSSDRVETYTIGKNVKFCIGQ